MKTRSLAAVVLFVLLLASCGPRHPVAVLDENILMDPGIIYGVLPNGFQYILKENKIPADRVNIHLDIFAGSMHETDDQQGLAHYLEHMLFNGSTHFKPGELITYFQKIGMDFGADANAHTGMFNTVYDLSLPKGELADIKDAFVVIEDYAKGALLLEQEINRERGIILAEKRERDSVAYRTFKKSLSFELPDSLYTQRLPIGIDSVLKTAGRKQLKSYYDTWYRPDNMVLIVVGNFDAKQTQQLIKEKFSPLKRRALNPVTEPDTSWTRHKGIKSFYHYEPEAGSTEITIETLNWVPFDYETVNTIKRKTLDNMASRLVQNRLSRMVTRQTAGFSRASVFTGPVWRHLQVSAVSATCRPDNWEASLGQVEKTLRQALEFGFSPQELARVKSDFIASLESAFKTSQTRKSPDIAGNILNTINRKGLLLSAEQQMNLLVPYIESVNLKMVNEAFNAAWDKDGTLVMVSGNTKISDQPEKKIQTLYEKSLKEKITQYKVLESKPFPYLQKPASAIGIRNRTSDIKGLGITSVTLENNVKIQLKATDFKKNKFSFKLSFGNGKISQPLSRQGLAALTRTVIAGSGLGSLDADQLADALAGKNTRFGFDVESDSFTLSGMSEPAEAELVFQLIQHFFMDPAFRPEALSLAKTRYRQQYETLVRTVDGTMQIKGNRFLAGGDTRFGLAHPDQVDQYTLEDVKQWLTTAIRNSSIELCIVGDIDIEDMISLGSAYLGALGNRSISEDTLKATAPDRFPAGETLKLELDTKIDAGMVRVAFLTDDFWDIRQTRRLSVLSRIISEKLRVIIREELGEAYSPFAFNRPSKIFDGYGVFHIVVQVKSENQMFVYEKIKQIIESLYQKGVTQAELQLVLKPILNHIKEFRKTNGYWLNSVMSLSSRYPEKFDWAVSMENDYRSVSEKELKTVIDKYLKMNDRALILMDSKG